MTKLIKLNTNRSVISPIPSKEYRYEALNYSWWVLRHMYLDWRLEIPYYQRWFVWTEEQQIKFIESVIANIPIPPVIIVDLDRITHINKVRIIDGQQRITTMMNYLDYLESKWEEDANVRLYILNRTIPCTRISLNSESMKDFDEKFYYDIFNYWWTAHDR